LCTHFAQAFKRGMVCWPKGFQAWQKETFKIPPAERRARLQYHASLYHKPSTIMAIDGASGKLLPIGEGLFSRLSYTDNETIVSFCGDLITNEDYERECLAGRGGYAVQIDARLVLNCHLKFKESKCLGSYANSPQGCVVPSTKARATANAKLVVNKALRTARLVAHGYIAADAEILWSYNVAQ
jgi:hypothetical protein